MRPSSLLFIKPGSMGDVIHALPVASSIHNAWPGTKITWIVDPRWEPLLRGNPAINRIHLFPRERFRGAGGFLRSISWYRSLRKLQPEMALDLQCLLRSGVMASCSGAKTVFGLDDAREGAGFFYTNKIRVRRDEHAVRRYLRSVPSLGIDPTTPWQWILPAGEPCRAISPPAPYIVLHPFSRGAGKSMDAAAIREFVEAFRSKSEKQILIVGAGMCGEDLGTGVVDLLGKTSLLELISLLRGASFVVSVDSGPMHLAAALDVPLLSIHTWSDPRLVGPYSEKAWIWQGGEIRRQNLDAAPLPERAFTPADASAIGEFAAIQR
ncbi:MAG: glycosyltransferase family 9 protein [Terrimicrobiaceae bacterium]